MPAHVLEGDAAMGLRQQLGAALAEAHGLAAGALHLARERKIHTPISAMKGSQENQELTNTQTHCRTARGR